MTHDSKELLAPDVTREALRHMDCPTPGHINGRRSVGSCVDENRCECQAKAALSAPAPPPSDDVQSALADDLDLIGAAISRYRHPSAVAQAFYRVSAALRSAAPVSKP